MSTIWVVVGIGYSDKESSHWMRVLGAWHEWLEVLKVRQEADERWPHRHWVVVEQEKAQYMPVKEQGEESEDET